MNILCKLIFYNFLNTGFASSGAPKMREIEKPITISELLDMVTEDKCETDTVIPGHINDETVVSGVSLDCNRCK